MVRIVLLVVFLVIASDIQGRVQEKRIIHGTEAKPGAWPWVVLLQIKSQGKTSNCGGTILSKTWIMTAAHCFKSKPAASDILVAGAQNIKVHEESQQRITAKRYVVNPGYNPPAKEADIALIELSTPLKFNKRVEQARIQAKDEYPSLEKTCFIAGWGRTSVDPIVRPDTLQEAQLPILPERLAFEEFIYAGFKDGDTKPNACYGDSGGPLMCKTTFLRRWVVQGPISHSSVGDCMYDTAVIPVAKYLSWVKQFVKDLKTQN
ncbi:chymotrypsinogen A-like [Clytia hemisphaerica]|uniref:Peptidase S1 domain-containing protein n=1 Tax=Clytia hemisphaerica TaxID=252671 RepID=A0A7M5VBC2_9CNID